MRRSSTEKDVTSLRKSSTEKDVTTVMRRSSTEKNVTTLVKGSSEATSLPTRANCTRLQERRKSLPTEELHEDIQRININFVKNRSKTISHRSKSNSSKSQKLMIKHIMILFSLQIQWTTSQVM